VRSADRSCPREAIEVSSEIFGPGSDVTLNNQMNALLIEQAAPT
jgi:hypothetical protein